MLQAVQGGPPVPINDPQAPAVGPLSPLQGMGTYVGPPDPGQQQAQAASQAGLMAALQQAQSHAANLSPVAPSFGSLTGSLTGLPGGGVAHLQALGNILRQLGHPAFQGNALPGLPGHQLAPLHPSHPGHPQHPFAAGNHHILA